MNIKIQQAKNELTTEEWVFRLNEATLVLHRYTLQTKESKRHKFRIVELHNRTYSPHNTLEIKDVPLPEEVKKRALDEFVARISVVK